MELLNEQQPWSNKRAAVELAPPPSRSVGQGDVKDSQSSILFGVNIEQRSLLGDDSPAGAFGPMSYRCGLEAAQLLDEPPPALLEVKPHDGTFLKVYTLAPIHFIPFWFSLLAVCASYQGYAGQSVNSWPDSCGWTKLSGDFCSRDILVCIIMRHNYTK